MGDCRGFSFSSSLFGDRFVAVAPRSNELCVIKGVKDESQQKDRKEKFFSDSFDHKKDRWFSLLRCSQNTELALRKLHRRASEIRTSNPYDAQTYRSVKTDSSSVRQMPHENENWSSDTKQGKDEDKQRPLTF